MKSVCVYCGSSSGVRPLFSEAAKSLGVELAKQQITLVYGGASVGLMGTIADIVLDQGGQVIGVIPQSLVECEVAHGGLTELRVTSSMHERKTVMAELSDGFIAMPGGIGTLEELFEIWTWSQLGFHNKPYGILNADGYFDALLEFLDRAVVEGFVKPEHRKSLVTSSSAEALLQQLHACPMSEISKWNATKSKL